MSDQSQPIRSSSAPKDWTPPEKHARPAYQPPTNEEEWQPPKIIKGQYTNSQNPVIDDEHPALTQSNTIAGNDVSPSQLAKLAGVKPQMIYNYITQGLIECFINDHGRKRIEADVANEWLDKYLTNKREREANARRQIERQLDGTDY